MTDNNVTRTFRRIERLPVDKRRAALDRFVTKCAYAGINLCAWDRRRARIVESTV
jgi:hypothetical protein